MKTRGRLFFYALDNYEDQLDKLNNQYPESQRNHYGFENRHGFTSLRDGAGIFYPPFQEAILVT